MAHNIFNERFVARREPAWHGLGRVFEAPIGALEAIEAIGGDFEVRKIRPSVSINGIRYSLEGVRALMREPLPDDPDWRYFGTVNENYGVIQNSRLGELLDPLTDRWPVETAGLLGYGETLFLVLDAGEQDIEGDTVRQFFLIADTKNGKESLKAIFTPVRVVCQNTLIAGEGAAVALRNFKHHKDIEKELKWHMDMIAQFEKVQARLNADFTTMARAVLADTKVWEVINDSYPEPKMPAKVKLAEDLKARGVVANEELLTDAINVTEQFERLREQVNERRDAAYELATKTAEQGHRSQMTAWDVYNGIVEVEDYRKGRNDEISKRAAIFGDRARTKARAFKLAKKAS